MIRQIVFILALLVAIGIFSFTANRFIRRFLLTKSASPVKDFRKRFLVMAGVAFGQSKIFRMPVIGLMHALVFWGFCIILLGTIEMIIDGITGTEKVLKFLGPVHNIIMASGDIFGPLVALAILVFLFRRLFLHVRRFNGIEMKVISHLDANIALILILLLMITLISMNAAYVSYQISQKLVIQGYYPFSNLLIGWFSRIPPENQFLIYETSWWTHILLIFLFANILPYSKNFHVFMSVPNVFLSRLEPLGKLAIMDKVTREVRMMMHPETASTTSSSEDPVERFGVKDVEDITWKNYLDSLACTECGRCTSVCPANITGKQLSPRKILMDIRARMKEKGPYMVKFGKNWTDKKALLREYISEEELWACTTCNACAKECPVNINHPSIILDMRRYLVLEEASAPAGLKNIFNYIENNGAPWQFSPEDRLLWAKDISLRMHERPS